MAIPYGPKGSGDIRKANSLPRGMSSFPVVGGGLGGLPVEAQQTIPPRAILVYGNGGMSVYDGKTLENITSTFVSNPTLVSSAGGTERLNVTSNNRYLGFGSWARSPNLKGAVADTSTTPWTFYSNFTGLALPGTGNDIVERVAPSTNGLYVIGQSGAGTDEGVFSFTVPSTEYAGQPTQFTTTIPWSSNTMPITIGDTAWIIAGTSWYKFTFTTQTLSYVGVTNVSPATGDTGYVSFNSTKTVALLSSSNTLYKVDISSGTPVFVASYATGISGVTIRSAALSPDGTRAICACTGGKVFLYTFATGVLRELRTPSGFTDTWDGVDFFDDGNNYVVTGVSSTGYSHLGRIIDGGYVSLLDGTNCGYNILCLRQIV
jgi:hypothetical protein